MQAPKIISIKARLRRVNYANFLDYYHNQTNTDFFYEYLTNLAAEYTPLVEPGIKFRSSFNAEGFYFKLAKTIKCTNSVGKPCLLDDILDHDVTIKCRILPYNFTNTEQIIGIQIKAIEIKAHKHT